MSILDDAIREHLELKRRHGADDSELKQLEDEAFGPAERPSAEGAPPDAAAEAPTEFMEQPPEAAEEAAQESARREPTPGIADLQEPPPPPQPAEEPEAAEEPPPDPEHSTEERHAIAEQPTEMFDVEGEIAASESRSPSDEDLVAEELQEPRLAPVDPLAGLEDVEEGEVGVEDLAEDAAVEAEEVEAEEEDDFFDEQRLSEELDQALEPPARADSTPVEAEPLPEVEDEDFDEGDEGEEHDLDEGEEDVEEEAEENEQPTGDVLGGTPDFLEEAPEDDQLWFEQKPPKDFDFDD